jgi:hypothetical protein
MHVLLEVKAYLYLSILNLRVTYIIRDNIDTIYILTIYSLL